jgi:hypothetical protein
MFVRWFPFFNQVTCIHRQTMTQHSHYFTRPVVAFARLARMTACANLPSNSFGSGPALVAAAAMTAAALAPLPCLLPHRQPEIYLAAANFCHDFRAGKNYSCGMDHRRTGWNNSEK